MNKAIEKLKNAMAEYQVLEAELMSKGNLNYEDTENLGVWRGKIEMLSDIIDAMETKSNSINTFRNQVYSFTGSTKSGVDVVINELDNMFDNL